VRDKGVDHGYEYLGNGPAATGGGVGWHMRAELHARCVRCGDYVSLDPNEFGNCRCGAIHKDRDAGRFGSSLGDDQIEVYRRKP
jgi:hypothetical protein